MAGNGRYSHGNQHLLQHVVSEMGRFCSELTLFSNLRHGVFLAFVAQWNGWVFGKSNQGKIFLKCIFPLKKKKQNTAYLFIYFEVERASMSRGAAERERITSRL